MATMRAKVKVTQVTHTENGHQVRCAPVSGGSAENDEFFKWTPSGSIELGLLSEKVAESMVPGAEFYIDFIPA